MEAEDKPIENKPVENKPVENKAVTTKEMLNGINAAIMAVTVGGQSYKIGSRSLTRADLKQLYAMKNDLTAQMAAENSSGLFDDCYVAVFDGR